MFRKSNKSQKSYTNTIDILLSSNPFVKNDEERAKMTVSCKDCNGLSRHKKAGLLTKKEGIDFQYMHNGILVKKDAYYGSWMTDIIKELKGHHEPQEEKVFHAIINRLEKPGTMIEMGSFWSLYSLWYVSKNKKSEAYCIEPDPDNIEIGRLNARINKLDSQVTFLNAACGEGYGENIGFETENKGTKNLKIVSTDWLVDKYNIKNIDILHLDIQGFELGALKASVDTIKQNKVRFVFVSTHHYAFSKDPRTHEDCVDMLKEMGANIIAQHNILESFSGDGLIVASFDKRDKDFKVEITRNTAADSLFRSYETDLKILDNYYKKDIL